jgi:hypothetical protein
VDVGLGDAEATENGFHQRGIADSVPLVTVYARVVRVRPAERIGDLSVHEI